MKDLSNLTVIELRQNEQSKITMARNSRLSLPIKARFRPCVYFGLTKDAEPIKPKINTDNKENFKLWKSKMMS